MEFLLSERFKVHKSRRGSEFRWLDFVKFLFSRRLCVCEWGGQVFCALVSSCRSTLLLLVQATFWIIDNRHISRPSLRHSYHLSLGFASNNDSFLSRAFQLWHLRIRLQIYSIHDLLLLPCPTKKNFSIHKTGAPRWCKKNWFLSSKSLPSRHVFSAWLHRLERNHLLSQIRSATLVISWHIFPYVGSAQAYIIIDFQHSRDF